MQGSCTEAAEQLCETEAAMQLAAEQLLSSYTEMHKEAAMMQLAAEQLAAEQLLSRYTKMQKEAAMQLAAEQLRLQNSRQTNKALKKAAKQLAAEQLY